MSFIQQKTRYKTESPIEDTAYYQMMRRRVQRIVVDDLVVGENTSDQIDDFIERNYARKIHETTLAIISDYEANRRLVTPVTVREYWYRRE